MDERIADEVNSLKSRLSFSILELSVAVVIIAIAIAAIIASRSLIINAKLNKVQKDFLDLETLTNIFQSTFDCLPGDCRVNQLPSNIYFQTPNGCFNMDTDYITPLVVPIITEGLNTGEIESNAKRTCMFYELQAFDPQAFGASWTTTTQKNANTILSELALIKTAYAVGLGKKIVIKDNPKIQNANQVQINTLNAQIASNNVIIANNTASINTNNTTIAGNNTTISNNNTNITNYQNSMNSNFTNTMAAVSSFSINAGQFYDVSFGKEQAYYNCFVRWGYHSPDPYNNTALYCSGIPMSDPYRGYCLDFYPNRDSTPGWSQAAWYSKCSNNYISINGVSSSNQSNLFNTSANSYSTAQASINSLNSNNTSLNNQNTTLTNTNNTLISSSNALTAANNSLQSQINNLSDPNQIISLSIETATQPNIPGYQTYAMWDVRTSGYSGMPSSGIYPMELANPAISAIWKGRVVLIARSNNTNSITDTATSDMSAFDSNFSARLDRKYDDGLPGSGNIIAGKNQSQINSSNACTNLTAANSTALIASVSSNDQYASGNKVSSGCIVAWRFR